MPVSIVPVVGNGGDAHPGYRTAALLTARLSLMAARGAS